jgi:hypothetical protein
VHPLFYGLGGRFSGRTIDHEAVLAVLPNSEAEAISLKDIAMAIGLAIIIVEGFEKLINRNIYILLIL